LFKIVKKMQMHKVAEPQGKTQGGKSAKTQRAKMQEHEDAHLKEEIAMRAVAMRVVAII